jgi:hypothetical protein
MITTRIIDGLNDEIKSAMIIQRPADLDTACSLAMLQEDVFLHTGRREMRRTDFDNFNWSPTKPASMPLPLPPVASHRTTSNTGDSRGSVQTSKGDAGRLTALRDYRRARGLCFNVVKSGVMHTYVLPPCHYTSLKKWGN